MCEQEWVVSLRLKRCEEADLPVHFGFCSTILIRDKQQHNVPKTLFSLSFCYAVTQRVPLRTPSTARCPQPGETSWPGSDRGSWPTRFTTSGKRVKTSLLLDTSTLVSGKAVRNTTMVRPQSTQTKTNKKFAFSETFF